MPNPHEGHRHIQMTSPGGSTKLCPGGRGPQGASLEQMSVLMGRGLQGWRKQGKTASPRGTASSGKVALV